MEDHRSQLPSPLLIEQLSIFRKGKALDVACGFGRNALFLASKGFEVTGLDGNPEAVAFCNAEAKRRNLGDPAKLSLTVEKVDLEGPVPIPSGVYDLVTCFYYLDRKLLPHLKEAVRPGGHLVYETFLIDQHERFGKPGRKEFCWGHNELLRSFLDFRIDFYFEGFKGDKWIAQLVCERPAGFDRS